MGSYRGGYIYRQDMALVGLNAAIMAGRPDPDRPRYTRNEAPCGTPAAYRRHKRCEEKPCEPCRAAEALRVQLEKEKRRRPA